MGWTQLYWILEILTSASTWPRASRITLQKSGSDSVEVNDLNVSLKDWKILVNDWI